jgi:hypothetical protein
MVAPNYTSIFAFAQADPSERTLSSLLPEGTVEIVFSKQLTPATVEEGATWLRANRLIVTDLASTHRAYTGKWRQQSVSISDRDTNPSITVRYAKYWDAAIDFTHGKVVGGFDYTTGDPWLSVQFPSVSRDQLPSWISAIRGNSYVDPRIGEKVDGTQQVWPGTWQVLAIEPGWAEDGSANPIVHLGDPDWIVTAYRNYGLPTQTDITYLFNIPKANAQAMIDDYNLIEGATVTVQGGSRGSVPGTVDITVSQASDQSAIEMTLTIGALCEVTVTRHHRWGMTKAQAESFAATFSTSEVGIRKDVSVSFIESSGKYNASATISEITAQADLSLTIGSGWDTTEFYEYRWGFTEEEVNTFISDGSYDIQEQGKRKRVTVTKTDTCTFSLIGIISDQGVDKPTLSVTTGVTELSIQQDEYRFSLTDAELASFVIDYESKTGGKRKSVRPTRRDDGLWNVIGTTVTIDATSITGTFGTSHEQEDFDYQFRVTEAEKDAIVSSLQNTDVEVGNRSVSISRNGDDTYSITIRLRQQKPAHQSFNWKLGTLEHGVDFYFGRTPDDMVGIIGSLDKDNIDYNIQLSRGGDGTYSIAIRKSSSPGDFIAFTIGNANEFSDFEYHYGLTTVESQALLDAVGNDDSTVDRDIRLRQDREGRFDVIISARDQKAVSYNAITRIGGNFNETSFWDFGLDKNTIPLITKEANVAKQMRVRRDRMGGVSTEEDRITVEAWTSPVFDISINKNSHNTAYLFHNYENIPTLTTTLGSIRATYDQATQTYSGTVSETQFTSGDSSVDEWDDFVIYDVVYRRVWRRDGKDETGETVSPAYLMQELHRAIKQTRSIRKAEKFINLDGVSWPTNADRASGAALTTEGEQTLTTNYQVAPETTIEYVGGGGKYRAIWVEEQKLSFMSPGNYIAMPDLP